jgi:hypothetical protein
MFVYYVQCVLCVMSEVSVFVSMWCACVKNNAHIRTVIFCTIACTHPQLLVEHFLNVTYMNLHTRAEIIPNMDQGQRMQIQQSNMQVLSISTHACLYMYMCVCVCVCVCV